MESDSGSCVQVPETRLIQELVEVRTLLKQKERQCRELNHELTRLKFKELPARESEKEEIALINRLLRVFALAKGDELFDQVLEIIQEGLESEYGVFGYISEPGHLVCPSLSRILDACEVEGKCIHYPPAKWKGLWARALREKRAFYINQGQRVPAGHPPIMNNLAVPVIFQDEAIGLLNLANKTSGYKDADLALAEAMADRIAPFLYAWIQKKLRENERARTENTLRQSELFYRQMLESIPGMVFTTKPDGYCDYQSQQWVDYTGVPMEKHLGNGWNELLHPEDRRPTFDAWCAAVQEKAPYDLEYRVRRHDGVYEWFRVIGRPIRDTQDQIIRWFGVAMNIQELKEKEAELRNSEERVRRKLESLLSPEGDLELLELQDLIDIPTLQTLMEAFYTVSRLPVSIVDNKGRLLVGVGWQDICTRFHRVHPLTSRNCLESDTHLAEGISPGELRQYKCKNNMWDIATPVVLAGRQLGNLFTGQFFFEDETVDRDLFRAQASRYGFDENDYLCALDRVPRLSRDTVGQGMTFLIKLAETLSKMGYSNAKLARLLVERDRLTDSLRESRTKLETALASMTDAVLISDAWGRFIDFNDAFAVFHRFENKKACSSTFSDSMAVLDVLMENGQPVPGDQWPVQRALRGEKITNAEYLLRRKDTGETWVGSYSFGPIRDANGLIVGSVVVCRDITERKQSEKDLRKLNETLEQRVIERTVELEHRGRLLQELARQTILVTENDRRTIAKELHDSIGGALAGIKHLLEHRIQAMRGGPPSGFMPFETLVDHLSRTIQETRRITRHLRPSELDEYGLEVAVKEYLKNFRGFYPKIECIHEICIQDPIPEEIKLVLYRVFQESMNNIGKYSRASLVRIRIEEDPRQSRITLEIIDNGQGFDADSILTDGLFLTGFGLKGMQERVELCKGSFRVESSIGNGTAITAVIPINRSAR